MSDFNTIAREIGELVTKKNGAYGNSFEKSKEILQILYPNGVEPEQYQDMLALTRLIDKMFRIANKKDAFGESPWRDIAGYAILGISNDENGKKDNNISPLDRCDTVYLPISAITTDDSLNLMKKSNCTFPNVCFCTQCKQKRGKQVKSWSNYTVNE